MRQLLILYLLILSGCSSTSEKYDNGQAKEAYYKDELIINNFPSLGKVTYYETGIAKSIHLSKDFALSFGTIPRGAKVLFSGYGQLDSIVSNKVINLYKADFVATVKKKMLFYNDSETLKSAYLYQDTVIQGVPCKASLSIPVVFYPDGKIKSCKLYKDYYYSSKLYKANSEIQLSYVRE